MAISILMEYTLRFSMRGTMGDVVIALITFVTAFINGGYITQNIFRDTSLNKNGLRIVDGIKQVIPQAVTETTETNSDTTETTESVG